MKLVDTKLEYYQNDDFQILRLPYANNAFYFTIILPRKRFGLADALKKLDSNVLKALILKLWKSEMNVSFKIRVKICII
jgi:serine protease inhibitor